MSAAEHLDVLVIGAGLSGIGAAHYLQSECPWAKFSIFEARDAIGGTWDLFRYPGIRSDSDMYTLGYSFKAWTGEKAIADGASILKYIRDTAEESGLVDKIRFAHRVVSADWSSVDAHWRITAERTDTAELVEVTADFIFSCSGYYRYDRGYQPDFPGAEQFQGQIIHPQAWPEDLDYSGKRVVVIGSGATAVTLVPSMAKTAGHVTMLQRSPTYVASLPAKDPIARGLNRILPPSLSGPAVRWYKALTTQASYQLSMARPEMVKKFLRRQLERQLPKGFDIDTHFTPKYNPWDQRLCVVPNGDMFKAIRSGSASVVTGTIDTFTEHGILLNSGEKLEADIIVTATGLELLFLGGMDLKVDGEAVDISNKLVYKGMMLEGVPNMAVAIGYTNASWTLKCDLTCDYVCRLLNRMHSTAERQVMPVNTDPSNRPQPLLGLTSGYVQRSADSFPKQGSKFPWRVYQNYLQDYRALKLRGIDDPALSFTAPSVHRSSSSAA